MQYADTQVFTMADAPTQKQTILNPTTFPTGGPRSSFTCPTCSVEEPNIGRHFALECEYPLLTQDEASTLLGAWLVGAYVNPPEGRGTPRLIIRADDSARLSAIQPYLGLCGRHTFDMTQSERKQLNTTPHPALEELYDAERTDITFTRRVAAVVYLLRGTRVDENTIRFQNLIDGDALRHSFESIDIEVSMIDDSSVELTGDSESTFSSWTNTKALDELLESQ